MKVDQGFTWNYWKLSYRRKLIRTLWIGILVIIIPVVCYLTDRSEGVTLTLSIAALILWSLLLFYNAIRFYFEKR